MIGFNRKHRAALILMAHHNTPNTRPASNEDAVSWALMELGLPLNAPWCELLAKLTQPCPECSEGRIGNKYKCPSCCGTGWEA